MGSTFTSVRSLRYVIFPVQVLAKSCKPIPVMIMGALMGKKYPIKKVGTALVCSCLCARDAMASSGVEQSGDVHACVRVPSVVVCLIVCRRCFVSVE